LRPDGADATMDRAEVDALPRLAHDETDWARVSRTTYSIRQHLHYQYPVPIRDLRQRLILVPPLSHGDQKRLGWGVEASCPAIRSDFRDRFGNVVVDLVVDTVPCEIEFDPWPVVERRAGAGPHRLAARTNAHALAKMARPSTLTMPDDALRQATHELVGAGSGGLALGERICHWVHRAMAYRHDVTSIRTTAAQALALGAGVCQDYAHIALTICRLAGVPARYVSGHLLGEGGSHAWIEVMVEDPDSSSCWLAVALDPTHDCRAGLNYLTIATGRDYRDVAPTSGSYRSAEAGSLAVRKHACLVEVVYRDR